MNYLTPPVGLFGHWSFKTTLGVYLDPRVAYTSQSVSSLRSLIKDGINPLTYVYVPLGLTNDDYKRDLADNVFIVALQSQDNKWINVPTSYIESFPSLNGVIYTERMITIHLGLQPILDNYSHIDSELRDFILSRLGVDSVIRHSSEELEYFVSVREHESNNIIKRVYVSEGSTSESRIKELEERLAALQRLYANLEHCVVVKCMSDNGETVTGGNLACVIQNNPPACSDTPIGPNEPDIIRGPEDEVDDIITNPSDPGIIISEPNDTSYKGSDAC